MRMWGVDPSRMCDKHLLGEHVEMHMFVGAIAKSKSLGGYVASGFVNTALIVPRHDALAEEMTRRGMNHQSPLVYEDRLAVGVVDPSVSMAELERRCERCRMRT